MTGSRIGKGAHEPGVTPPTESARVLGQIERGEVRVGPDAAREIAQKIEDQGGFWGARKEPT